MIHITKGQFELLEQTPAKPPGKARPRKQDLPENVLEKQICDYLAWRGFLNLRQHVGLFVPYRCAKTAAFHNVVNIGQEGMADWLSIRPAIDPGGSACEGPWLWQGFFWECKGPGRKPSAVQLEWLNKRRRCGFEAAWFNQFHSGDRRTKPCGAEAKTPRDSYVFLTWFHDYFERREKMSELMPVASIDDVHSLAPWLDAHELESHQNTQLKKGDMESWLD